MDINALRAQAAQSAAQGQAMLGQDRSSAANYQGQYDTEHAQAATYNQQLGDYTNYMQNAGNPLNLYNTGITQAEQSQGFDPAVLANATQNLTKTQNAINQVSNASQSSTGGYGLSGAQLGQYYGSLSQPLQSAAQSENNAVGNYQQLYQNALTQAQQGTTLGFQGEQQVSANLNQQYQNAQTQAAQSMNMVQFYNQLASSQGGLNAQQAASYNGAIAALQQAQAAMQQASAAANLANKQAAQIQQGMDAANAAQKAQAAAKAAPAYYTNGSKGNGAPSILQDNIDFWTGTAPKAVGHAATSVAHAIGGLF